MPPAPAATKMVPLPVTSRAPPERPLVLPLVAVAVAVAEAACATLVDKAPSGCELVINSMALGPFHQASDANTTPKKRLLLVGVLRRGIWILDKICILLLLIWSSSLLLGLLIGSLLQSSAFGRDGVVINDERRCAADATVLMLFDADGAKESTWRLMVQSTARRVTKVDADLIS